MKIKLPKIKFLKPKNKKILALDNETFYRHKFFLNKSLYNTLFTRYEEFYFFIFIKSLFIFFVKQKKLTIIQIYILETIKWLDPKYIITFTDYNHFFLTLKNYFPQKKIIVFQNSYRSHGTLKNIIRKLSLLKKNNKGKLTLDYFFIFGKKLLRYYDRYFKTKFIMVGCIRNNLKTKKKKQDKKSLVIISHYTNSLNIYKIRYYKLVNSLNSIAKYCKLHKFNIVIFGRADPSYEQDEKNFYKEVFKDVSFKYYSRKTLGHYYNSEKYSYFISFTSTLGYELATKYKRVAFIYGSLIQEPNKELRFGYPQKLKKEGNFWTHSLGEKEIFRILNYTRNVSNNNWRHSINKIVRPVMDFDNGNKNIKKVFGI